MDPELIRNDATGSGAFETSLTLVCRKIFYTWPKHPYNWEISVTTAHTSAVRVEGINSYNGELQTKGTIKPGERFHSDLAFEYKFDKNWGWGFDLNFIYQNSLSFHRDFPDNSNGAPSSYLLSFAPEVEYSFSEIAGISAGIWFSVAGRNTPSFFSGALTAYYEF